jgi:hypothetical protein
MRRVKPSENGVLGLRRRAWHYSPNRPEGVFLGRLFPQPIAMFYDRLS